MWASALTARPIGRVSSRRREAESQAVALATDFAQGSRIVKGLGVVSASQARFDAAVDCSLELMLTLYFPLLLLVMRDGSPTVELSAQATSLRLRCWLHLH